MELINVLVAGLAAFAAGAVWYSILGKSWMTASGVPLNEDGNPANSSDPKTYITGLIAAVVCAGMMRHVFELSAIDTMLYCPTVKTRSMHC